MFWKINLTRDKTRKRRQKRVLYVFYRSSHYFKYGFFRVQTLLIAQAGKTSNAGRLASSTFPTTSVFVLNFFHGYHGNNFGQTENDEGCIQTSILGK